MAKHRRHRRYNDVVGVTLNGLGLSGSVDAQDVVVGLAAGVGGAAAIRALVNNVATVKAMVPPLIVPYLPEVGAAAVGAALYFAEKGSGKAKGHAIGAAGFAAASLIWKLLQATVPTQFAGVVSVRLNGVDYGVMVDDSTGIGMGGMIVDDSTGVSMGDTAQTQQNLAELAAASMGDDTDDPFVDALEMLGAAA